MVLTERGESDEYKYLIKNINDWIMNIQYFSVNFLCFYRYWSDNQQSILLVLQLYCNDNSVCFFLLCTESSRTEKAVYQKGNVRKVFLCYQNKIMCIYIYLQTL